MFVSSEDEKIKNTAIFLSDIEHSIDNYLQTNYVSFLPYFVFDFNVYVQNYKVHFPLHLTFFCKAFFLTCKGIIQTASRKSALYTDVKMSVRSRLYWEVSRAFIGQRRQHQKKIFFHKNRILIPFLSFEYLLNIYIKAWKQVILEETKWSTTRRHSLQIFILSTLGYNDLYFLQPIQNIKTRKSKSKT